MHSCKWRTTRQVILFSVEPWLPHVAATLRSLAFDSGPDQDRCYSVFRDPVNFSASYFKPTAKNGARNHVPTVDRRSKGVSNGWPAWFYYNGHFHEGLLTLKSFPNVSVGIEKFSMKNCSMLCSYGRFVSCLGIWSL